MNKPKIRLVLNQGTAREVVRVFKKYGKELPYEVYRKAEKELDYQVQWSQPGEPTMLLTYSAGNGDDINIHYEPQGFALLNKKSDFPFDWTVRLNSGGHDLFTTVRPPKDFVSANWLKQKNPNTLYGETNEMFIVFMFLVAKCCTAWFGYCFDKKSDNGRDLIFTPKKDFYKLAVDGWESIKEKYRVEHLYDDCDTVTMDEKQFRKMGEYVDEIGMNMSVDNLSIENFAFRYVQKDGLAEVYQYTMLDGGLLVVVDSERKGFKRFSFCVLLKPHVNSETGEFGWDSELKTDVSCGEQEIEWLNADSGSGIENWQWLVYTYFGINTFMLNYRDVSVDVQEIECKPSNGSTHKVGERKARTVVKMFKRYTLKKDWKKAVSRKKMEYHCLAWSVRGHFRTMKNGKKVFVRPYVKGKEKDKYVPKDYIPIPSDV